MLIPYRATRHAPSVRAVWVNSIASLHDTAWQIEVNLFKAGTKNIQTMLQKTVGPQQHLVAWCASPYGFEYL